MSKSKTTEIIEQEETEPVAEEKPTRADSESTGTSSGPASDIQALVSERKPKRAAIFTHANPDPDAIGSLMAGQWVLERAFGVPSDLFYTGHISHPQNKAVNNLLDPGLRPLEEYSPDGYDFFILVDTVPKNAGVGEYKIEFDIVIDHHKDNPPTKFKGVYVNLKAGSACGTIYHLVSQFGVSFQDDSEVDSRVATAMLVGIITDTENMMADETTEYEFEAYRSLFEFRNGIALRRIINFERPKLWTNLKADASKKALVQEGVGVVGMGLLAGKHRDVIADMASEMVTWEDVNTAIVFALMDGERVEGSVRSNHASVSVPSLCSELGGRYGRGGGKLGKGAYCYDLGGGGIEEDDDDETRQQVWFALEQKEIKRIMRIVAA